MGRRRFQQWVGCNLGTLKKSCDFSSVNTFPPNSEQKMPAQGLKSQPEIFLAGRPVLSASVVGWLGEEAPK
jgi:hypothetical protein